MRVRNTSAFRQPRIISVRIHPPVIVQVSDTACLGLPIGVWSEKFLLPRIYLLKGGPSPGVGGGSQILGPKTKINENPRTKKWPAAGGIFLRIQVQNQFETPSKITIFNSTWPRNLKNFRLRRAADLAHFSYYSRQMSPP